TRWAICRQGRIRPATGPGSARGALPAGAGEPAAVCRPPHAARHYTRGNRLSRAHFPTAHQPGPARPRKRGTGPRRVRRRAHTGPRRPEFLRCVNAGEVVKSRVNPPTLAGRHFPSKFSIYYVYPPIVGDTHTYHGETGNGTTKHARTSLLSGPGPCGALGHLP